MNRNRLVSGSEIEAAEADRATRPTHKLGRNALRCSALRSLGIRDKSRAGFLGLGAAW